MISPKAIEYVLCPVCGGEYTHADYAYALKGNDEFESEDGTAGLPTYGMAPDDERRGAVVVTFKCEFGHYFGLVLQQHKGVTQKLTQAAYIPS